MKKILLVSCSIILICVTTVAAVYTYVLSTDTESARNHLITANLDVTLTRTNLEYSVLDENGALSHKVVTDDLDFTTATDKSVFGINSSECIIVPGSYFEADMEIANKGNVKFTYSVKLVLLGDANALSEQLQVTVMHPDGETAMMLNELSGEEPVFTGELKAAEKAQAFSVRIEFLEDANNNSAKEQSAVFDLVVTAVQSTTQN